MTTSFVLTFLPFPIPLAARSARARVTLWRGESFEVEAAGEEEKEREAVEGSGRCWSARLKDMVGLVCVSRREW